jgi:hypothetical protein
LSFARVLPTIAPVRVCLAFALVCAVSTSARAVDFSIWAETIGQGYQLRSADDAIVNRRRITQSLGLEVWNLGPRDQVGRAVPRNQFYISTNLRFDAEMGNFADIDRLSGHTPLRDPYQTRLELLWAHLGGSDLFGFLDFKLGRQVHFDLFDFRAFDGLWVAGKTPFHVAVEAWGGLRVAGAAPFDSPIYRADGVATGGNPFGSLGARQEEALEPTFGVALRTHGLRDWTARLSYERTMSPTGETRRPGEPAWGVNQEQLALSARARLVGGRLHPWIGVRYSVLHGLVDEIYAGARMQLARHALQAEYVYAQPTFDGDSIWNVFGAQAFNDVRLVYDVLVGRVRGYARTLVRLFGDEPTNAPLRTAPPASLGTGISAGGALGARLDVQRGYLRLDGYFEDGYGGQRAGVDLAARMVIFGDFGKGLSAEGRISYAHFRDDLRPLDAADSLGLAAGLRYRVLRGLGVHLLVEENLNRLYASQFRLVALLDLSFWMGPRGGSWARQRPEFF